MLNSLSHLDADTHNFGKRTEALGADRIVKFRNLTAEYLLLGENSSIRKLINELFEEIVPGAQLLPALKFFTDTERSLSLEPSEMERLIVSPVQTPFTQDQYLQIGGYLATVAFSGLTDSHRNNLVMGFRNDQFVFVSVDCETILTDLPHAITLGFFAHESACPCPGKYCQNFGLSVLKSSSNLVDRTMVAKIIFGNQVMRNKLLQNKTRLDEILNIEIQKQKIPRRHIFKYTYEYYQALVKKDFSNFFEEEKLQLARGDIPYFFQIIGDDNVYYWSTLDSYYKIESSKKNLSNNMKHFKYDEMIFKQMVAHIAQSLDFWPGEIYSSQYEEVMVIYKKDTVTVMIEGSIYTAARLTWD